MFNPRSRVGVEILNGIMYAVGGQDSLNTNLNSVEVYNPRSVWTNLSSMHKCRSNPSNLFFCFKDGLLYIVGGGHEASVEIYNPKTDIWTMLSDKINVVKTVTGAGVFNTFLVFKN